LLKFLEAQATASLHVGIAIENEQFHEILLHGRLLTLGKVVLTLAVVPLAINLFSNYVQQQIDKSGQKTVRLELIVTRPDGAAMSVKYDGPAEEFETTVRSALNAIAARDPENRNARANPQTKTMQQANEPGRAGPTPVSTAERESSTQLRSLDSSASERPSTKDEVMLSPQVRIPRPDEHKPVKPKKKGSSK